MSFLKANWSNLALVNYEIDAKIIGTELVLKSRNVIPERLQK